MDAFFLKFAQKAFKRAHSRTGNRLSNELPRVTPAKTTGDSVGQCQAAWAPSPPRILQEALLSHTPQQATLCSFIGRCIPPQPQRRTPSSLQSPPNRRPAAHLHFTQQPGIPWPEGTPQRRLASSVAGADHPPPFFSVPRPSPCGGEGEARTKLKDRDVRF